MEQLPAIKIGDWVVITEDGLWAMNSYTFKTKAQAIDDVSCATLDVRKTPKVKRQSKGDYFYYPKDVDYGTFGDSYNIKRVTKENINEIKEMLEEQWKEDPLSNYDQEMRESDE
ncbi:hypothetical protein [Evansella clarkii]|uniref:hypothetical protein n=1 Tax=Evansella clarkii TaxID=79879 RepID=UPI000996E670|nr:hypothetical protein [Evansella clarkii]